MAYNPKIPEEYSKEFRNILLMMLLKDYKKRISIEEVLRSAYIKKALQGLLINEKIDENYRKEIAQYVN